MREKAQAGGKEERSLQKDDSPSMKSTLFAVTVLMTKYINLKEILIRHFYYLVVTITNVCGLIKISFICLLF